MGYADRQAFAAGVGQAAEKLDMQASVDSQGRQMTVVAPMTETFLLGRLPRSRAFTAENDDAVQILQQVIPSLTGSGQLQHDRSSVGGLDGGRRPSGPQRATAAF